MRRIISALAVTAAAAATLTAVSTGTAEAAPPHTPVVFVHGYLNTGVVWAPARAAFQDAGYKNSELFTYSYDFNASNKVSARGLAAFVEKVKADTGSDKVDIVNHSMGGMVSLWYVKELGGASSVAHIASLAGAHHGTYTAGLCSIAFASCKEMTPGSDFLNTLTSGDETPGPVEYRTWYSPCDGVINPYTSTKLQGATNTLLPCEPHFGYLADSRLLSQVAAFTAAS
ncbi:esterase/lipase family protein [Streptomyces inhibens]|uniref:esterase/lipase family protein n=1 Tax=Streptomyces inhibens TaxID=2293571 RepID=UPI001EE6944D|nr:alpha/beta fold hydrolase [Streptomyces inhibens]UKY48243.1 alpha/beta fold hydrolase [Streptomyces inhibens]